MASYFDGATVPKILITTSPNARVVRVVRHVAQFVILDIQKTWKLCFELKKCLPNAEIYSRKNVAMKRIVKQAEEKEFTDIVVVHEDHKTPSYCQQCLFTLIILLIDALVLCHLPNGPTAHFKINSLVYTKKIKGAGQSTDHFPEIILNNFRTRLGHTISRMFECLFPRKPDFIGRRVITIHNQRYHYSQIYTSL